MKNEKQEAVQSLRRIREGAGAGLSQQDCYKMGFTDGVNALKGLLEKQRDHK